ncbi:MAG: DUF6703 family protein [Candidatus Nanopelagicales bacterium]
MHHPSLARPGGHVPTPPQPESFRASLDRVSRPWLLRLTRLPRPLLLVVTIAVSFGGLLLPGFAGAVLLLLLALFFGWLLLLAWPLLSDGGRLLRGIVVLALLGGAIAKAIGSWG